MFAVRWILLALGATAGVVGSPTPQLPLSAPGAFPPREIPAFIDDLRTRFKVPGLGIGLVKRNGEGKWDEYAGHFGQLNAQGEKVRENSLFSIASNSKLFTMMAIGLLVENGTVLSNGETLKWSTKIKDILPEWQLMDPYASDHVDLVDLLAHRSGLPRHDESHGEHDDPADVVAGLRFLRPSYEIRQKWQYNNQHYITLAHIVTTLSGMRFQNYVGAHILVPLGMTDTTYNSTWAAGTGTLADGFIRTGRNYTECRDSWNGMAEGSRAVDESCLGVAKPLGWWTKTDGDFEAGAGGIITSPRDLLKWLEELAEPKVLPPSLIKLASETIEVADGQPEQPEIGLVTYGLAQEAWSYRGINVIGHTGSFVGQRSLLIRVPDYNFAAAIVTNDEDLGVPLLKLIGYRIIDLLTGIPVLEWERRIMGEWFNQDPHWPDVPVNPPPPPPAADVLGLYYDRGYGNMSIKPAESFTEVGAQTLVPINVTGPIYIAEVHKAFVSHIIFTHYSGHLFNYSSVNLLQAIGRDRKPTNEVLVNLGKVGSAVIDGRGVGMFGNYWGGMGEQATYHADEKMDPRADANVWFDKV